MHRGIIHLRDEFFFLTDLLFPDTAELVTSLGFFFFESESRPGEPVWLTIPEALSDFSRA